MNNTALFFLRPSTLPKGQFNFKEGLRAFFYFSLCPRVSSPLCEGNLANRPPTFFLCNSVYPQYKMIMPSFFYFYGGPSRSNCSPLGTFHQWFCEVWLLSWSWNIPYMYIYIYIYIISSIVCGCATKLVCSIIIASCTYAHVPEVHTEYTDIIVLTAEEEIWSRQL